MYGGYLAEQSNRSDWQEAITLTDEETDDLIDISLCRITLTLRPANRQPQFNDGNACAVVLTGSTDSGEITLPELGTFLWTFPAQTMSGVRPGSYDIGVRISQSGRTVQLLIGSINIIEGIDTQ